MNLPLPRGLSVLLIEDDEALTSVMQHWAAWVGAAMDSASLGATALSLAARRSYDVVLLDLTLPDMDGGTVYQNLVRIEQSLAVRTIILTGGSVSPTSETFLESAVCPVVLKPFDLETLNQQIARLRVAAA